MKKYFRQKKKKQFVKQLSNRVETLETRTGEYLSHKKRIDFLKVQINKKILDSECNFKHIEETRSIVSCSEDFEKLKNTVLVRI